MGFVFWWDSILIALGVDIKELGCINFNGICKLELDYTSKEAGYFE